MKKKIRPWKRLSSERVSEHRIFTLRQDLCVSPRTGKEHPFLVMEGVDWVNVIPVTAEGNVVLVEQWRHGVRRVTLELPGGMVDAGETPAEAAARELLEETGYAGGKPEELGWIHPNPAIQANRTWTYLVRGAKRRARQSVEGTEDIATVEVPLAKVPSLIRNGKITHALVVVGFTWLWLQEPSLISSRRRRA